MSSRAPRDASPREVTTRGYRDRARRSSRPSRTPSTRWRRASRIGGGSITVNGELPVRLAVSADPDSLSQVVATLLQNAARYPPPSGTVWVRAEQQRDSVLLSVANTGPGIPAGDLGHVFERFYRVEKSRDSARGGAGIGLAIVKQLVEAVGGQVGAEADSGITRFLVRLPASA